MNQDSRRDVLVVGAGVIGVCCAVYLQRQGRKVTVVDRLPPGEACSFGNAGSLSPGSCVPNPAPGMIWKVPGWLFKNDGPLSIRWRYLPRIAPWLLEFIRAGDPQRVARAADALRTLHAPTFDSYQELAASAGVPELVRSSSYLVVYGSEASYQGSLYGWSLRKERGVAFDVLSGDEVRDMEPDLSPHYEKGVLIHDQGMTLNPSRLVKALAAYAADLGTEFVTDEVTDFDVSDRRVIHVKSAARTFEVDNVVIAGGSWSRRLTRKIGIDLPLDTERGYHATIANPGIAPTGLTMEADYQFMATPMEMGVRIAGMVELAGVDAPPNPRRAEVLVKLAKRMFPRLNTTDKTEWMGRRPSMPDGLPVIGRAALYENVYLAFGHGHTGMVGGPMTGRIIAGLLTGNTPNIDLEPYSPGRF